MGKAKYWRKPCSTGTLSTTNPTYIVLELLSVLGVEKA
jgi:hypothetical protein